MKERGEGKKGRKGERKENLDKLTSPQQKGSMFPLKITDAIVMSPDESDLEGLPDKEFKGGITERFRQLKERTNVLQEHKNEQPNEIKTSIQNMKIEFNKERELLEQSQRK